MNSLKVGDQVIIKPTGLWTHPAHVDKISQGIPATVTTIVTGSAPNILISLIWPNCICFIDGVGINSFCGSAYLHELIKVKIDIEKDKYITTDENERFTLLILES